MGFSSELCSPQGHGAVQQMQEAELRLLEGMRKWMAQRVKSDREYAGLLHHMSLQDSGGQSRGIGPHSPISQSWTELTSQTEGLSRVLRQHAEDLNSGPLSKLSLLIRERQQMRRTYNEQWQQLQQEFTKCHSQDIEKLKSQYRALARDSAQARRKYQEAAKDKDRDKAKDKYVRSLWKLFAHHNRYVLGVRAAQLHHQHHHRLMLPSLLQSLQDLHQEMACILKETLQEYLEISSLVQDEVVTIHREMAAAVARIQPEAEYQGFLQQYGSAPDIPPCVTFDESLLEETELLESGELQLNELTVESVQHTLTSVTDDLAAATQTVLSRQEAVTQLQRELWNEEQTTHARERVQLLGKKQALQEALQGLQVALCGQAKLQAQQELLQAKMERLGPGEPPPVLLLQDDRHSTSSSPGHPLTSVPGLRSRSEKGEGRPPWRSSRATSRESSVPSSLSPRRCSSFQRCRNPCMSRCGTMGPSRGPRWLNAVTQITTESPGKATFSSEIFVNAEDHGREIPELSTQKLGNVPVKFASSSSVQQITVPHGTDGQPLLLPYKPSGSSKMYYVPQLTQIPSSTDSKSDTTIESSHSGSNDAIAPDFPAQVLGTRDDDLADTVNIKHKEGIYSKRAVTKASLSMGKKPFQKDNADAQVLITGDEDLSDKNQEKEIYTKKAVTKIAYSEEKESLQKDATGSSTAAASQHSTQLQDTKTDIKQKEEIHSKRKVTKEAWSEEKKSLQIDIAESKCHSEFENTTHSVFRSAKFYFHHPVHLSSDQDFCHESLGRSVFMKHSWKDFFQHHPDKQREYTCLPSPCQHMEKTKTDYTRIQSLSINVNLENKELKHASKSQARDFPKSDKQINDLKRDPKATPELTTEHTVSLNELWNRYQERQKQQKPEFSAKKELSLVERLDRLAKLLQHPITHSLQPSESTQDDSRGEQDVKEWGDKQQQQKNKLQKKKQYKSLEKCHKNTGDLKKNKILSTHQAGRSNQIKIEQFKFDKYILRKQPGFHYINNTSSDSRQSEDSELLTDTATNILSTTTSPVESDILTQTDKEMTLQERSSSISTIDTARLIHAFGHERVCLSPRRIKLYSSITDHQRRYLEKRSKKNKKALNTGYPQITSEHTRRKHIQVTDHVSSDSVSSSTSSFWSSNSTLCNKQNAHMLNKGVQAGNLEIVSGVRKNTRDVGMTFPTPSSSEARMEEDSDVTSWSEEKIEEKRLLTSYLVDKKLKKNKKSCCEGVSWFVPVENMKSGPKKENMPKLHGPGVSWFAPITNTKPWREPLREQNWQGRHMDSHSSPAGPGKELLKPFVRATLQESLQLHRPDFISRSGERIKRLKLIVQERKLQNMLQTEREALFNAVQEWQGYRDPMYLLHKRGFLAAQKKRPIGKKEMIQRSKRIYEQLPEVQKKRDEEKRRSEYKSYRLRAQLYKKKVTNQLLGRKVPWD